MMTADEYRKPAQECVELAQKMREPQRMQLLQIAQAWFSLADEGIVLMPPDQPSGQLDRR